MNIEGRIRELGPVDSAALSEAILAQEEAAWIKLQTMVVPATCTRR